MAAQRHAIEPDGCLLVHRVKVQQHMRVLRPPDRQHQLATVPHAWMVLPHARQIGLRRKRHLQQHRSGCVQAICVDPAVQQVFGGMLQPLQLQVLMRWLCC